MLGELCALQELRVCSLMFGFGRWVVLQTRSDDVRDSLGDGQFCVHRIGCVCGCRAIGHRAAAGVRPG